MQQTDATLKHSLNAQQPVILLVVGDKLIIQIPKQMTRITAPANGLLKRQEADATLEHLLNPQKPVIATAEPCQLFLPSDGGSFYVFDSTRNSFIFA